MSPGNRLALDVLFTVHQHVNERGVAPTVRQLAALLRRRSWTPVQRQVRRLIRHGLLLPAGPSGVLRPTQTLWRMPVDGPARFAPRQRRPQANRCAQTARRRRRQWYGAGSRTEVDPVAVERALDGDPTRPLGVAEKVTAIRIAVRRGWNDREIAERIGVTPRHVLRTRQRHGIGCGVPRGTNQHSARHGTWGLVA